MKKITTLALGLLLPCLCMAQQSVSIVGSHIVASETTQGTTPITVRWEGSTDNEDWPAIYSDTQVTVDGDGKATLTEYPDKVSYRWFYTYGAATGETSTWTVNKPLTQGYYYLCFFPDDKYNISYYEKFYVSDFRMSTDKKVYAVGDPVVITWSGAPNNAKDWLGLYLASENPGGGVISYSWNYTGAVSGEMTLNTESTWNNDRHFYITPGEYYVTYMLKDSSNDELYMTEWPDDYKGFVRVPFTVATTYKDESEVTFTAGEQRAVCIKRNIKVGYNTVCLPFSLTAEQVADAFGEGTEVYTFSENSDDANNATINFSKNDGTISANVPVLVKATKASDSQVFENVTLVDVTDAKVAGTNFDFVGTYAPMTVAEGDYFISGGKLYKSKGATSMNAFHAYIQAKTDAPVKMFIDDFETSINELNANLGQGEAIYNVAGQRIAGMQKGINIVNGKKVLK